MLRSVRYPSRRGNQGVAGAITLGRPEREVKQNSKKKVAQKGKGEEAGH